MCKNYMANQNIINVIHKNLIMYCALWCAMCYLSCRSVIPNVSDTASLKAFLVLKKWYNFYIMRLTLRARLIIIIIHNPIFYVSDQKLPYQYYTYIIIT